MLYQLYDLQRSLLQPFSNLANVNQQLFSNPFSPLAYTPISKQVSAGYELFFRLGKEYEKPTWNIDSTVVDGNPCTVKPYTIIEKPFCKLIHFRRNLPLGRPQDPKVLLVAPLSGHHATLLRDTVKMLIQHHDVYVTDWIDAKLVPTSEGTFHLHDYVYYIRDFIRFLSPHVHTISVCQPTVPVLGAISLMATHQDPATPVSMTMMGGPIDSRKSPTEVNNLAMNKPFEWFEQNLIHRVPSRFPGVGRSVYPGFLQHMGFVAMNPSRHLKSHQEFYEHLIKGDDADAEFHRKFYDEYNAVLDLPAEFYLETIKTVFQEHQLPMGTWYVGGELVKPQNIKNTALLTIEGELDDISGSGQTQAAHDICKNIPKTNKFHFEAPGCGHYGIFSGRRWREVVYPKIADFIQKYDKQAKGKA